MVLLEISVMFSFREDQEITTVWFQLQSGSTHVFVSWSKCCKRFLFSFVGMEEMNFDGRQYFVLSKK